MTPIYFGTRDRRLFGTYLPPTSDDVALEGAVLVCGAWGPEQLYAHRSLVHLSRALAARGQHVLRFDYFGAGDSAGDSADGDLPGWTADIECAIDELKDMSGLPTVKLVGLRLGANLAGEVTAKRDDVTRAVLWAPIADGERWLAELEELAGREPLAHRANGLDHLLGYATPPAFLDQVRRLKADEAADERIHCVPIAEAGSVEPAWREEAGLGRGALPVELLHSIAERLIR